MRHAYGALSGGSGFASHTFCEVFVGGRWRRLNFTTLGQNILERNYLGLMIHVHTFKDLSEANLAATWGTRYGKGQRDDVFKHSNPYRLVEVSDHFGNYATVPNPPADKELKEVTIAKAYWPDKEAPAEIREMAARRAAEEMPLVEIGAVNGDRRFYIHCEEWLKGASDYLQYKLFMRRADTKFLLRAKGQPDVSCQISMNFYTPSFAKSLRAGGSYPGRRIRQDERGSLQVEARFSATAKVLFLAVGRYGNQAGLGRRRISPQLLGDAKAIHPRQADVAKYNFGLARSCGRDAFRPRISNGNFVP
jgi:hypothetical protein